MVTSEFLPQERASLRTQVRQLWECCFNDSKAFVDLYFKSRYTEENNIALLNETELIAALQMLPYPMTFCGTELRTAYVSGACTHPDHRNRGAMSQLLVRAFVQMRSEGIAFSTLIPAEPWLFGYYAHQGYAPVFRYSRRLFHTTEEAAAACPGQPEGLFCLQVHHEFHSDLYAYLNRLLHNRSCCIQHTEEDFKVIIADLQLSGGAVCILRRSESQENEIVALAFLYPTTEGTGWYIGELLSDTPQTGDQLLQRLCQRLHTSTLEVLVPPEAGQPTYPLGMARIIDAPTVLQQYASVHPATTQCILLADPQLESNNGCYLLHEGHCIKKNATQLPDSYLALTIGELTEYVFASEGGYMSLMLN